MIITANVVERTISVDNMSVVQNNVSIDTFLLTLDGEWDGVQSVKVVFYCKSATKEVQYQEGGIDIPWEITEYTDGFMITVVGYFANGDRLVTRKMRNFINVDESGLVEGEEAGEATKDIYQSLVDAAFNANDAADAATESATNADAAAQNAQAIADNIRQRAEAGEFNGAAFSIKYERASFEEIQAISDAAEGDFAIIIGADKMVDDYGKLYTFNGSEWHLVTDMSVPGPAIKGDKGDKGVSVAGATIDGSNLVIQTTDPSTGATTDYDAGSLTPVVEPVVTAELDTRILVMDKSDYDSLTEYATGVVYLVRE